MKIITSTILTLSILLSLSSCQSKQKKTTVNKHQAIEIPNVFPEKGLTDAHTIFANGRLYAFCGHDESWDTENGWHMDRWETWSTENLSDWRKESEIHPRDTYIGDLPNCFAGDIIERNGKYYWYFSNRNKSTGVMVADSPTGPFVDALGEPLLPTDIIKGHPYDPEIYEEDGEYTIIFGAGHYYAATLAEDMISLAEKPQAIKVLDKVGKDMWTADKSCVFKRNDKYYLIWEHKYAMADNLRGPYQFMGESLEGGHCNVFQWEGQYYCMLENKDIGLFYRGVSLKPLNFNPDGTIIVPESDAGFPANGRTWNFNLSRMGWRAIEGTEVNWNTSKSISGAISGDAIIESSPWLLTNMREYQTLKMRIRNNSSATQAKVYIASINPEGQFWSMPQIIWAKQAIVEIALEPNSEEFQEISVNLSKLSPLNRVLRRLRIEPAVGTNQGTWEIDRISIEK